MIVIVIGTGKRPVVTLVYHHEDRCAVSKVNSCFQCYKAEPLRNYIEPLLTVEALCTNNRVVKDITNSTLMTNKTLSKSLHFPLFITTRASFIQK